MSDHHGHPHDRGDGGPTWMKTLLFWLAIALLIMVAALPLCHRLGLLPP